MLGNKKILTLLLTKESAEHVEDLNTSLELFIFLLRYTFLLTDTPSEKNFLKRDFPPPGDMSTQNSNGARYLDPKYSRWLSVDPALGEYVPAAGKGNANDAGNLPGMGGIYNSVNGNLYHYAGNNPVKYTDPDGRIGIPYEVQKLIDSNNSGLTYEPEKWNDPGFSYDKKTGTTTIGNPDSIQYRTNCYAYAMNLQENPISGKQFSKRGAGKFALQPGDLCGIKLTNLKVSTIETLVFRDCERIGYTFKESSFEGKVKKSHWKITLVIREDDYHWYRQNKDGTWSHKPGEFPVTNLDDAECLIRDPRNAVSSYQFVKFYEVGPND